MGIQKDNWELYFFPNEEVLKNKLDIHNKEDLKKCEYEIVARKNALLYLSQEYGNFSIEHLKGIHQYLFEDIYPFAGEFRIVNMGKGIRASFTDYERIEENLAYVLKDIDDKLVKSSGASSFLYAEALANMYRNLLDIHPFREGNGRTIREFLREYVISRNFYFDDVNYELDFNLSDEDKDLFEQATIMDTRGYLVLMFNKMLKAKPKVAEMQVSKKK